MNELALFAGAGGGMLGGQLLGWRTICAVEIDSYCRRVLLARQKDGALPRFPIWDDICTFEGERWRGRVDVVTGGFPCQDISAAGKGSGLEGERSGLWKEMARVVREVEPQFVYVENSPMLTGRGLNQVLMDLAAMGYDAQWGVLGAWQVGAPHKRDRIWILAHTNSGGQLQQSGFEQQERGWVGNRSKAMANTNSPRCKKQWEPEPEKQQTAELASWWSAEPELGRVAHGVAKRVDRLKAIGNGQVPAVAATAFSLLMGEANKHKTAKQ